MQIRMVTGGLAQTNAYLVWDESTGEAVLFDAPDHTVGPLLNLAEREGLSLKGLWLTHGHFDHLADHQVVRERFPKARVLIHRLDLPKLHDPRPSLLQLPFTIPPGEADDLLDDGQELRLGTAPVRVIHTPGHCAGHVCFHFPEQQFLIGGDLIICDAVGRTDLPDSDPAALDASIREIMKLPAVTALYPGHCGPTTLAEQRQVNPFVQAALRAGTP
jgi:glyoxylase-like metal-dependent hydrolase (beta-lactamase superfamily II)